MTPNLRAALEHCRFLRGSLGARPLQDGSDQYLLRMYRGSKAIGRFLLTWPEWYAAYCYWQELSRPGIGMAGKKKRRRAA